MKLKKIIQRIDPRATVIAGLVGGVGYIVCAEIDNRLTGKRIDDLTLLGRPFVKNPEHARAAGLPIHLMNAVSLAGIYAALDRRWLPGPTWAKGMLFATIENTVLYPIAALEDHHPAIKNGEIDRYFTVSAYLQSVPRHLVYGALMATLYERLRGF